MPYNLSVPARPGLPRARARRPLVGAARLACAETPSYPSATLLVWWWRRGGVLVYPPEGAGLPWRATFTENGRRRFWQAMTEAELAVKLEKVTERLRARAPDMERPGADLIGHYLDPDRLPVGQRWSRGLRCGDFRTARDVEISSRQAM